MPFTKNAIATVIALVNDCGIDRVAFRVIVTVNGLYRNDLQNASKKVVFETNDLCTVPQRFAKSKNMPGIPTTMSSSVLFLPQALIPTALGEYSIAYKSKQLEGSAL